MMPSLFKNAVRRLLLLCGIVLAGCTGLPKGVAPVDGFELQRYLGKWYEIARLDHAFERGLSRVSAEYERRDDGGIDVLNRGYDAADDGWKEAQGRAYFVTDPALGHLKVSFFRPFYSSYVIFELDKIGYRYAFISGPDRDYLWLLSRTPEVEPALYERFVRQATELGFDTAGLIRVQQQ